jgi:phage baseplate assembly protein W
MESFIRIPVVLRRKNASSVFEKTSIEASVKQFIELLILTRQGECAFNLDFGYEIWSNEFEPILNIQQWQPKFMEHIKYLLEKYEPRITDVQVWEPDIRSLNKKRKSERDYVITLTIDYRIKSTGELQNNVKISFEF